MGCCCRKSSDPKRTQRTQRPNAPSRDRRTRERRPPRRQDNRTEEQIAYQLLMRERASAGPKVCVATFPYLPGSAAEIQLEKGDRVELLEQKEEDTEDFVFVRVLKEGGKIGYVATNYLAPEYSVEAEDYYFGPVRRRDAVQILRNEALPGGAYLVRDSETTYEIRYAAQSQDVATPYVLSVKDYSQPANLHHYRIYDSGPRAAGQRYYISSPSKFKKITDVIAFYASRDVPTEICCRLTTPVQRPPPIRKVLSKELLDKWREIPRDQIRLIKEVGSGNFGCVWEALWSPPEGNPMTVAVKQLKDVSPRAKDQMFKEAAAMRLLSHRNIVRLYGVVSSGEPYLMVTEFVKDGSLKRYLETRRIELCLPPLPDADLIDIATQICRGMAYLESKGIVHRDLAARNVLINLVSEAPVKMAAKICDFGLARVLSDSGIYKMARDTALAQMWLAPEAFNKSRFTNKSDVWAFGATLCELFSEGRNPFPDMPPSKQTKLLKRGARPTAGTKAMRRANVEELIFRPSTRYIPEDRPTFAELLADLESLLSSKDDAE